MVALNSSGVGGSMLFIMNFGQVAIGVEEETISLINPAADPGPTQLPQNFLRVFQRLSF